MKLRYASFLGNGMDRKAEASGRGWDRRKKWQWLQRSINQAKGEAVRRVWKVMMNDRHPELS